MNIYFYEALIRRSEENRGSLSAYALVGDILKG